MKKYISLRKVPKLTLQKSWPWDSNKNGTYMKAIQHSASKLKATSRSIASEWSIMKSSTLFSESRLALCILWLIRSSTNLLSCMTRQVSLIIKRWLTQWWSQWIWRNTRNAKVTWMNLKRKERSREPRRKFSVYQTLK